MERIKLGLVGCGAITQIWYGPIFKFLESGRITAMMDTNKDALERANARYGSTQLFTDYDKFLTEADIDAVIVASPNQTHRDYTVKAAEAKKHVFCEKPMARTLEECDDMIEACKRNGVHLMIGVMKRFNPCFQLAKEIIDTGEMGDVFQFYVEWECYTPRFPAAEWSSTLDTNLGGHLQNHGPHSVDLAIWYLGDVESVSGCIDIIQDRLEVEDVAWCLLRHKSGAVSIHNHNSVCHKPDIELYRICGTKNTMELRFDGGSASSNDPFKVTLYNGGFSQRMIDFFGTDWEFASVDGRIRRYNPYYREFDHFCRSLLEGKSPSVTGIDGRKSIEAVIATYLASSARRTITLPLKEDVDLKQIFVGEKKRSIVSNN